MNNEERILSILENMQTGISELKTDVAELKTDLAELKTSVTSLEKRTAALELEVHETNLKIEVIIEPRMDSFVDGHQLTREKLDEHTKRLDRIERKVDDLGDRVGAHDFAIRSMRS